MKIKNISKSKEQVTMTLNKDELVLLCNTMYCVENAKDDDSKREAKRELFHKTYADLIMVKDLCQYGHIDKFSFDCMMHERKLSEVQNVKDYDEELSTKPTIKFLKN